MRRGVVCFDTGVTIYTIGHQIAAVRENVTSLSLCTFQLGQLLKNLWVFCDDLVVLVASANAELLRDFTRVPATSSRATDLCFFSCLSLVFLFSPCLETKASWLHVQAAAAHKNASPVPERLSGWQHLPRRCLVRTSLLLSTKHALLETSKKLKTRSSLHLSLMKPIQTALK